MGTSGSYGGPGPGGSLLPPDAPPPPGAKDGEDAVPDSETEAPDHAVDSTDGGEEHGQPTVYSWSRTKTDLSRYSSYSSQGRTSAAHKALGRAARGFVKSQGGSRAAAASSPAGRAMVSR